MSKMRWFMVVMVLVAAAVGLKPHFSPTGSPQASPALNQQRQEDITALTDAHRVASYLQQHQRLPGYYLTKNQARHQGWQASQGNLCDRLPGMAIGGDRFANREGNLPIRQGRQWYEADVNYQCGHRNADRLLYSSDGMIFLTQDHYRHFTRLDK